MMTNTLEAFTVHVTKSDNLRHFPLNCNEIFKTRKAVIFITI